MQTKILRKILIFSILLSFTGCGFVYNEKTLRDLKDPYASQNCSYEVLLNVKNDPRDANYIASQNFQTIGVSTVNKFWFWPWPPTIPYYRKDFKALVCETGADAIEVYRGVGTPHFRNARIRLLKRAR